MSAYAYEKMSVLSILGSYLLLISVSVIRYRINHIINCIISCAINL